MDIIAFLHDLNGNLYFLLLHAKATIILKQAVCCSLQCWCFALGTSLPIFCETQVLKKLPSLRNRWQFMSFPTGVISLPNWVDVSPTFPSQEAASACI